MKTQFFPIGRWKLTGKETMLGLGFSHEVESPEAAKATGLASVANLTDIEFVRVVEAQSYGEAHAQLRR